jgi:AraC-like DNA-binding protein
MAAGILAAVAAFGTPFLMSGQSVRPLPYIASRTPSWRSAGDSIGSDDRPDGGKANAARIAISKQAGADHRRQQRLRQGDGRALRTERLARRPPRLTRLAAELDAAWPATVSQQTIRALSRMVIAMPPSGDTVAQVLGIKRRRLRERLEAEGTSIRLLLEEVRCELARPGLQGVDA